MSHSFFTGGRPLVFAHRGGCAIAPENTIAAFDRGLALGADGLELDVRLSRDGIVVVHHDRGLGRTTNRREAVADLTAAELERLDAAYWFRQGQSEPATDGTPREFPFRGLGLGVPTLAAVLARYPDARIIVELKVDSPELGRAAVDILRRAGAFDRVCLGSFATRVLRDVRRLGPEIATSASRNEVRWALYASWIGLPTRRAAYDGFQVPELAGRTRVVSPRFVERAHAAGRGVQVWTVDSEHDARRLLGWGVDALITDRPDVVVPLVREWTLTAD